MVFIKHKTLIIVSVLGLFFIGLCTTGYFLWQYQKEQQNKPGVLYREAIELAQKGELHRAVVFMKEALINEPNNSSMHWFLSLIYDKLEKDGKAQTHALLAWENNRKDKEVLFFIVKGCGLNTVEEKIKYGLSLIGEMPDENERLEMRADMHSAMEEIEKALIIYQQLFDKKATPQLVTKVAITLIGLKRSDEAMKLLRKSMTDNLLEEKGYVILSNILFLHQKKDELKALFENAKSTRSYHAELAYQHALLSTIAGRYAQANKILLDIIHSETYEKLKQQQSRLLLALNSLPLKDSDTLDKLTKLVQQDGAAYEGERLLYATLKNALRGTKPQILRQKFDTINKLLPRRFIILLLSARIDTSVGNPLKALKYYSTIKNPVYQVWPLLVIDHVVALRADGKVNEALSLIVHLHNKRKSYTLQSAILQRNLLLQIHDVDGARRIQDFLEQNYPDLVYLKLQGATMALQIGEIEEADHILSELDSAEPYDLDIICMRAASFLSQKKYHKAINYLKEKPQSSDTLLITAKAYIALKNIDKAVETYELAITNYPSERLHRIYSYFLISIKNIDKAREIIFKAKKVYPHTAWLHIHSAYIDMQNKNFKAAIGKLHKSEKIDNKSLKSKTMLSECYYKIHNYDMALRNSDLVLEIEPRHKKAMAIKGLSEYKLHHPKAAVDTLYYAIKLNPADSSLKATYVKCLITLGHKSKAMYKAKQFYKNTVPGNQSVSTYIHALKLNKDSQKGLEILQKHRSLFSPTQYIKHKSSLLLELKKISEAMTILKQAAGDPQLTKSLLFLQARYKDLNTAIQKAATLELNYQEWALLAKTAENKKNYKLACLCYKKSLQLKKDHPILHNNYAWNLWKYSGLVNSEILQHAAKASSLDPDNIGILNTYANLLIEDSQFDECIKLLRMKISNSAADARLLYWQAVAYENKGQHLRALGLYKRVLKAPQVEWLVEIPRKELELKIKFLE